MTHLRQSFALLTIAKHHHHLIINSTPVVALELNTARECSPQHSKRHHLQRRRVQGLRRTGGKDVCASCARQHTNSKKTPPATKQDSITAIACPKTPLRARARWIGQPSRPAGASCRKTVDGSKRGRKRKNIKSAVALT